MGCRVDHCGIYASETSGAYLFVYLFICLFLSLLSLLHICCCCCNRYHFKPAPLIAPRRFVGVVRGRLYHFRKTYFRVTCSSDTYFFLASAILVFICACALASDASACTFLSSTLSRNELRLKAEEKKHHGKALLLLQQDGETGAATKFSERASLAANHKLTVF